MTKRRTKRALSLALSLILLLGLLPGTALAGGDPPSGGTIWTFKNPQELEAGYSQTRDGDTILLDYSELSGIDILYDVNGSAFQKRNLVVLGSDHPMKLIKGYVQPDRLEIRSGVMLISGNLAAVPDFILSGGELRYDRDNRGGIFISGTFDYRGGVILNAEIVLEGPDGSFVNNSGGDVQVKLNGTDMTVPAGWSVDSALTMTAPPTGDVTVDGLTITTTGGEPVRLDTDGQILLGDGTYTVSGTWSGTPAADRSALKVPDGKTAHVTLAGANIDVSGTSDACAFDMTGATVALTLAEGSDNILKSGGNRAGLEAPTGSTLTIGGSGKLEAAGGTYGAGIGGGASDDGGGGGSITITSGMVTARGGYYGAGIGGGGSSAVNGGAGGVTAIEGNAVVFAAGSGGAGPIGGGWSDGSVTNPGTVARTGGVIFEGTTGAVYSDVTLPGDLAIPDGYTLTIPDGKTLLNGHTLTNNGTINGSGILTGGGVFTGTGTYILKVTLAPPTAAGVTITDVTLNAVTLHGGGTVEYARSDTNIAPADGWQTGLTFTGLTAGTTYYFFARVTGDEVYQNAVSAAAAIATQAAPPPAASDDSGGGGDSPSPAEQAASKVEKARDGETVELDLPSGGKLPGKVLEAAAGKDVTLEIDAGNGVTWVINGKDIPKGKLSDLDLKVNTRADTIPVDVINALTGEKKTMQLTLSHDGPFGFPLTLRLDAGKENAGLFANLYYYDEAGKALEYQSTAKIGADGAADLPFSHASSYAVVIDEVSHAPVELPFTDVAKGDWCYEAVEYVYGAGLMVGVTETAFGPDGAVTRAQVWTVLARLDGADTSGGAPWYAPARDWAVETGVSDGTDPDGAVTREQLVTMLYRYAQSAGVDVSVGGDTNILSYDDAFDVAEWAIPAFQWACGAGVVSGTSDTTLSPQAGATRAQLAAVLTRMTEK